MGNKNSRPYGEKSNVETNDDVLNDEDTLWSHDLYEKVEQGEEPSIDFPAAHSGLSLETGTKLQVENLDYNVTEDDLKELFQQVGDVKKVKIRYDRSGRSEGSAEVIFARKGDAEDAVKKYNGVELDGKAMKISLLGNALHNSRDRDRDRDNDRDNRGSRGRRGGFSSRPRERESSGRRSVIRGGRGRRGGGYRR